VNLDGGGLSSTIGNARHLPVIEACGSSARGDARQVEDAQIRALHGTGGWLA